MGLENANTARMRYTRALPRLASKIRALQDVSQELPPL